MSLLFPEIYDIHKAFLDFIKEHRDQFILTGGMAIDFALKINGQVGIYTNNELKDYDMFTFDMNLVYELGLFLMSKFDNIKVINAFHPQTLKVRFNKSDIVDITLLPKKYFDKFLLNQTFTYEEFNVITPLFKLADIHKALFSPTRGSPNEAVFHRFKKDMERYCLLCKILSPVLEKGKYIEVKHDIPNPSFLIGGFLAYSIVEAKYKEVINNSIANTTSIKNTISINNTVSINGGLKVSAKSISCQVAKGLNPNLILISNDDSKITVGKKDTCYSPFLDDFIPRSIVTKQAEYHFPNTEITYHQVVLGSNNFNIVNIHYLMLWFLAMYFLNDDDGYLGYYWSLKSMIENANAININNNTNIVNIDNTTNIVNIDNGVLDLPFFVNMNVWQKKESPEMLIKGVEMYNKANGIQEQIWPLPIMLPTRQDNETVLPTIPIIPKVLNNGAHILLEIGHDELKSFLPYKKLEKHAGLY